MSKWKYTIDISLPWYRRLKGLISIQELAKIVAEKIRNIVPDKDQCLGLIDDFEELSTDQGLADEQEAIEIFDQLMLWFYDWADTIIDDSSWPYKRLCWINTILSPNGLEALNWELAEKEKRESNIKEA